MKTSYPAFRTNQYRLETWGTQKQIYIDDDAMKATIIGNFNIYSDNVYTGFQHDGWWYDYMSGDSLYVENTDMTINLEPGDWKIYTDVKLTLPNLNNPIDTTEIIAYSYYDNDKSVDKLNIIQTHSQNVLNVSFETDKNTRCNLSLYNHLGELVFNKDLIDNQSNVISYKLNLKEWPFNKEWIYICEIETHRLYRKNNLFKVIKGLIFDLDGVIVNTDIYHFKAWKQVASQYSIELDSSINERLKGLSRRDSWNLIMELGNIQLSDEETNLILETKNSLYRKELKNLSRDNILLGVEDFLQELNQKDFKLAIGSSSKNARDILHYLNS